MIRFLSFRIILFVIFIMGLLPGFSMCNIPGDTCYSTGGIVDECFTGWTPEECQNWDSLQVNGASWTSTMTSCYDLGFDVSCSSTHYVTSSADCP